MNGVRRSGGRGRLAFSVALVALSMMRCEVTRAADPPVPEDLAELSLDELLNIEVTSVSKRSEPLTQSAAAVFVLTADDLRRSGDRTIAEALRRVPGLHVARVGQSYAISSRGFNSTSSDKLQVLLDGRSVYTPLFSGVFWDVLDTFLPDVERIEVIRGPGATLWGANAVNGVINIVTRQARDAGGLHAMARGGTRGNAFGGARLGWGVEDLGHFRIYAQARADDNGVLRDGSEGTEGLRMQQGGFRADFEPAPRHVLVVSGDGYSGESESARVVPTSTGRTNSETDLRGGNLAVRWEHAQSDRAHFDVEAYWDHSRRRIPTLFDEQRDTFDLQFDQHLSVADAHELVMGLGYRHSRDRTGEALALIFDPASRQLDTWSGFFQDQVTLGEGTTLTLGSKFEHNDFTGFEVQPGARIGFELADDRFTWAAVSRAVRTPNRLDSDIAIFCPEPDGIPGACGPGLFRIGNRDLDAEELVAGEWGFRAWGSHGRSAELALFYNRYHNLRSQETAPPFGRFGNGLRGHSLGGELNLAWRPRDSLQLRAHYAYLRLDIRRDADGTDRATPRSIEGGNPRHMAGASLDWTPDPRWSLNAFLRYVDDLPALGVPAYTELNLAVFRRLGRHLEIGLVGENLLDDRHPEFGADTATRLEVERQLFLLLRWTPP